LNELDLPVPGYVSGAVAQGIHAMLTGCTDSLIKRVISLIAAGA
jgi:hypothetical protein